MMSGTLEGKAIDGRYRVVRALGEGAMGSVFLALDPDGTEVALKVVHDRAPDVLRAPQRFLREVKSLNKLDHPNIVQLLDFGRDEALAISYLVMELARGDDLTKLVLMGRAEPSLALLVARHVGAGLQVAHDAGVVHRDLKPANVMVCPQRDGSVVAKILDFGLAMLVDADTRLTKTGTAPGTVNYMAPEQLLGETADARTDIYGLGVILFELLSGRAAFRGENQTQTALAVLQGPAPPHLAELAPDVPHAVADLVADMLRRDRNERPGSAQAVVDRATAIEQRLGISPFRVEHSDAAQKPRAAWKLKPAVR